MVVSLRLNSNAQAVYRNEAQQEYCRLSRGKGSDSIKIGRYASIQAGKLTSLLLVIWELWPVEKFLLGQE